MLLSLLSLFFVALADPTCHDRATVPDVIGRPVLVTALYQVCLGATEAGWTGGGDPAEALLECSEAAVFLDASGWPRVDRSAVRTCMASQGFVRVEKSSQPQGEERQVAQREEK